MIRLALLFLAAHCYGCGARAYQAHYVSARASHETIELAADLIEETCTVERLRSRGDGFRMACLRAEAQQHLLVDTWGVYVRAAAAEGIEDPQVFAALASMREVYSSLRQVFATWGRELPELFHE